MTRTGLAPRLEAAAVVARVLREGAYSNVLVGKAFGAFDPQDRRFATSLVYGVLRNRRLLDHTIDAHSGRKSIDRHVRDVLRVATFELSRPGAAAHAIVDSAVEGVKELGLQRASGFVNGVLRAIARSDRSMFDGADRALRWSVPSWLPERLDEVWGTPAETDAFLAASHETPFTGLRLTGHHSIDESAIVEREVLGFEDAVYTSELVEGAMVQDPASIAVGKAAAVTPDETVLDMAAAPGGKAMQMADAGPRYLVAADRHGKRVARSATRAKAEGHDFPWIIADGRTPPFRDGTFDVVVLDAPCSGLGTLRRRPEIRDRVSEDDIANLATIQSDLLDQAVRLVKSTGRVVYSVCTVTAEETLHQVTNRNATAPPDIPGLVKGNGLFLAPHITGTDGMFISVVRPG